MKHSICYFAGVGRTLVLNVTTIFQLPSDFFQTFRNLILNEKGFFYSDGITESLNYAGEEFSHARLEAQLRRAQFGAADAMLFSVLGAV